MSGFLAPVVRAALVLIAALLPPGALAQAGDPMLWRISGPKTGPHGGAVLHSGAVLFGSFHLLPPDAKWRTPALERALDEAQFLVFETDALTAQKVGSNQALLDRYGKLPAGRSLRASLPEKVYADFERLAADLQIAPAGMDGMRPWLAAAVLGVQFMTVRGFDPNRGMEAQLADGARAKGKPLAGLESNEAQMKTFASLPPAQEERLFAATLQQVREMPARLEAIHAAYRKGDLAALDRGLNAGFDPSPELRRRLLRDRHARWLARMEKLMAAPRRPLFVVGAAHLAGPDGLVAMLRARGYRVESGPEKP